MKTFNLFLLFFFLFSLNSYSNDKVINGVLTETDGKVTKIEPVNDIRKQEVFKQCIDDEMFRKELGVSLAQYRSFCTCTSKNSLTKNGEFREDFEVVLNTCSKEIITIGSSENIILNCEGRDNLPPYSKLKAKTVFQVKDGYIYMGLAKFKIVSFNDIMIKAFKDNLIGSRKEYGVIILDRVNKEIESYWGLGGRAERVLKKNLIFYYKYNCNEVLQ